VLSSIELVRLLQDANKNKQEKTQTIKYTYEYFNTPSSIDVQIMTVLSALPDAKRFPSFE
jgi:mannose/fructose/N-acetylgalactosamine-specific phosphotransferase system component IID